MFNLKEYVILSTGFTINNDRYIVENSTLPIRNLHGTIIASIILHICNQVEFISIDILDENLSTDGRILAYSLSAVFDYNPDIIHMSLGTVKKYYILPLRKIIKKAKKLKIPIVAAADNSGKTSYPAYLRGVIGVKSKIFNSYMQYSYKHGFFYAPLGVDGLICKELIKYRKSRGTSMSAAYITGHLAEILNNNEQLSYKEVKKALIKNIKE